MKNLIAALSGLALALGMVTAPMAASVRYDQDRSVDMAQWKRWAFATPEAPGAPLAEKRIRRAIDSTFTAKGYAKAEGPGAADFVVGFAGGAWRDVQVEDTWRGPGFGRQVRLDRTPMGTLMVEVHARESGVLAWRGTVTDDLAGNPEQAEKKTRKAVEKLLKSFPACAPK